MVKIQFYPIEVDSIVINNKEYIRIFGKTVNGRRICVLNDDYKSYFWVLPEENIEDIKMKIDAIRIIDGDKIIRVNKTEIIDKQLLGRSIKAIKVYLNNSYDARKIADEVKNIPGYGSRKEIDVTFHKKYLIDNKITPLTLCEADGDFIDTGMNVDLSVKGEIKQISHDIIKSPRILAFDIETYNPERYSIPEKDPIIMVAFAGSDGFRKVITWKKVKNKDVEVVSSEVDLILRFKEVIKEYEPDYLVGYFSDAFDFPYIKKRADQNRIRLNLGIDGNDMKFRKNDVKINGIPHLDIFKFIRNIMSGDVASGALQLDSLSLGNVSELLLGKEKDEVDISKLALAWDTKKDLEKYCKYNLKDAELTLKVCERVLPNLNEVVKIVSQGIYTICRMSFGQLVEWYLMKMTREFNEIIPNKPGYGERASRISETYKGAFVFEPEPGLYNNVVVFDFRSLYPSIISAHNICPSTLTDDIKNANKTPLIGNKRYYFNYKVDGFIPQIIRDLIQRRIRVKELIKNSEKKDAVLSARSYALKILGNSFYGYLGYFGARWYKVECAESITAFARDYLNNLIKRVKYEGFNVIYGDTDSVAVELGNKTKEDAFKFLYEYNKELPSLMELELEDFYKRGIFVMKKDEDKGAKKKYALVNENDEIKVRGFETVRGDWSKIAKETQEKVLEMVLKEGDRKKALDYVKEVIKDVKSKIIDKEKMIIRTKLKKKLDDYENIGPHVAVARKMKERGDHVGAGAVIPYIIAEGDGLIRDKAKLVDECEDYDASYYIHNQIIPAIGRIFEVLGYNIDDYLINDQKKLGDF